MKVLEGSSKEGKVEAVLMCIPSKILASSLSAALPLGLVITVNDMGVLPRASPIP